MGVFHHKGQSYVSIHRVPTKAMAIDSPSPLARATPTAAPRSPRTVSTSATAHAVIAATIVHQAYAARSCASPPKSANQSNAAPNPASTGAAATGCGSRKIGREGPGNSPEGGRPGDGTYPAGARPSPGATCGASCAATVTGRPPCDADHPPPCDAG